jgi:hypothetical protein
MKNKSFQLKLLFILFLQQKESWIKSELWMKFASLIKHETKLFRYCHCSWRGTR